MADDPQVGPEEAIQVGADEATQDVSTFEALGLAEGLCKACAAMGYTTPTPIQARTIPIALEGRDVIGLAKTGSGKTAAFALPILHDLLENPQPLFALALAPTRELAFQIAEQFEALGSYIGVKCATIIGGVDMMEQAIALSKNPHIVVATPGRIIDHLENTKGFSLRKLKYLVMDEADRILNMDFEEEVDKLLAVIPKERRTYLFSATMTSKVSKLQRASLKNPAKIEVASKYSTVDSLQQNYLFIPAKHKDLYLTFLLNETAGNSTIVFTSTCNTTQRITIMLRNLGFDAIPLHGQMSQTRRLGSLTKFKAGDRSILVATDVASRGLDIPSVDIVVNFEIPQNSKDYIHRVGRTARAGRSGRSITFVTQYDLEMFTRIEKLIGKKMEQFVTEEEEVMLLLERVTEAQRFAMIQLREETMDKKNGGSRRGGRGGSRGGGGGRGGSRGGSRGGGRGGSRGGGRGGSRGGGRGGGRGGRGGGRGGRK